MLSPVEKTDPLPAKVAVSEESDDESAETSSTASNETVLSNDGSDKSSESDPLIDGPPFHDFIEAMVKDAIDSRRKELAEENTRSETQETVLEIEVGVIFF